MGPMVAALTVLGDRLRGAWVAPTTENLVLLTLAVAIWILIGVGLQVMSNRLAAHR